MSNELTRLIRLKFLFEEYLELLEKYQGYSHVRSIKGILGILYDETCSIEQRFREARKAFGCLLGGAGTLGDFGVWHDDKVRRIELNDYYDKLKEEILDLLNNDSLELPDVDEGYPPGHIY